MALAVVLHAAALAAVAATQVLARLTRDFGLEREWVAHEDDGHGTVSLVLVVL